MFYNKKYNITNVHLKKPQQKSLKNYDQYTKPDDLNHFQQFPMKQYLTLNRHSSIPSNA
jgi:spore coat protein CotF